MIDLRSIWALQKPSKDELIIKTKLDAVPQFDCFAATNHVTGNHLYIMSLSKYTIIPEFKNFKFKGVQIEVFDLEESKELNIYLIDSELKDIFSLFIENIIEEIIDLTTENEVITKTSNVIQKWKKLFDKLNKEGLTIEEQKGLLGELLVINNLIDNELNAAYVLASWTGPDFEDKDFTFGSTCFEVKFTISKFPRIKITSERQLNTDNINELYLINYIAENIKENGVSLNSIVKVIRDKIAGNTSTIKFFNERLESVGYFDDESDNYDTEYGIKSILIYKVSELFPRLTNQNIPSGVYNTSYYIENSAISNFLVDYDSTIKKIKND